MSDPSTKKAPGASVQRVVRRTDERATVELCWMDGVLMQRWEWVDREWEGTFGFYWHATAKTEWRPVPTSPPNRGALRTRRQKSMNTNEATPPVSEALSVPSPLELVN